MNETFNVVQFFKDGTHEYVRRDVEAEEAVKAADHYCHSVAVRMGFVTSVMITDSGDCCAFLWTAKNGVEFK
jgi:hypothetical protein